MALTLVLCVPLVALLLAIMPGLRARRGIARWGLRACFLVAGQPFTVHGLKRVPKTPCVAIANHRSYLDGIAVIAALPGRFTPVIKAGPDQVPIMGWVLRRVGARFIQRQPPTHAAADTRTLLEALRAGESLCMFPEGTFSGDGGLLPFRPGAFFLAAEAGVPVLPVVLRGTQEVLPEDRMLPRSGKIDIEVLAPMRADGDDRAAGAALRDRAADALWRGLRSDERPAHPGSLPDYHYYRRVLHESRLPAAYVDLDLLEQNTRDVLERSGAKALRVDAHVLRCAAVIQRVLRSHVRFCGVKCATVAEALYLADEIKGLDDLLVAYPTLQEAALKDACEANKKLDLTLTADSERHLRRYAAAAEAADVCLPVCLECDLSDNGGDHAGRRSAINNAEQLAALADTIARQPKLRLHGLLIFDTQRDNIPTWFAAGRGRRPLAQRLDRAGEDALHERRRALVEALQARGQELALVNGGGGGSLEVNAADPALTEVSVGSSLFAPARAPDDGRLAPAAGYAAEIMRQPAPDTYACLGGGYTAADTLDIHALPRPYLPPGTELEQPDGAGEAQIPIHYAGELAIGDPVFMRHANAGELCERFAELVLIQNGTIADRVPTYRGAAERLS